MQFSHLLKLHLVTSCLLLTSPAAYSGGYVRLGGMYLSESTEQSSASKSSRTYLDLGTGTITRRGLTLGLLYSYEKINSDASSAKRTSIGPTVGWVSQKERGPYLLGTYFLSSQLDEGFTGSGYQVDLGYKILLRKIALALQLSYKKFSYGKQSGQALSPERSDSRIDPYFQIWYEF